MSSEPRYPHEDLEYGETLEVAPGIFWLKMPLPFALDHINLYLIEDGDGWTVVDTGWNGDDVKAHWVDVLRRFGGRPLKRAIVTHFHPDHLGLAGWLQEEYGTALWMTYGEWLQAHLAWTQDVTHDVEGWMQFFRMHGIDDDSVDAYRAGVGNFGRWTTPVPPRVRRIWHNGAFEIGGRQWQTIVGGGHSPEHASLYCPELGVLISGDQVLPRITTNISVWFSEPEGDPLRHFVESFDRFRHLPGECFVLPSHNRPFYGLLERLDYLQEHHRERLDIARDFCDEPRTALELIPVLFKRELDNHQIAFAMGEALSHLHYLVTEGTLVRMEDEPDGLIRYRRADR